MHASALASGPNAHRYNTPAPARSIVDATLGAFPPRLNPAYNGTADRTVTSTFDARDRQTEEVDVATDGTSTTTTTRTYDANGSTDQVVVNGTLTTDYDWDLRERLKQADTNGDATPDVAYRYAPSGLRLGRVEQPTAATPAITRYLVDRLNPTGYGQVVEETLPSGIVRAYVIGQDVLAQHDAGVTASTGQGGGPLYLQSDGQGSTRALLDATGQPVTGQVYAYDAYGTRIEDPANPITPATTLLYTGEQWDPAVGQYYLRARYMNPATGTFLSRDTINVAAGDWRNANLHGYVAGDPVNWADPSGMFGLTQQSSAMSIGALLIGGGLLASAASSSRAIKSLSSGIDISGAINDLVLAGSSYALQAATIMMLHTATVTKAISDATDALARLGTRLIRPRIFPIIRSLGPTIFAFDSAMLAATPKWYALTYNGPGSGTTTSNRAVVWSRWGYLMATAPSGSQLDEFPYASTVEGGAGAFATPVPWIENAVQGGMLSAFYRYSLKSTALTTFLVVPIPI